MEEILAIMEEMGLLKNLKTDRITFCSEMFVKYDANDDGVLRRALRPPPTCSRSPSPPPPPPPTPAPPPPPPTPSPSPPTLRHQRYPRPHRRRHPPPTPTPPPPLRSFDEFKGFYNAAIDDARGRKRAPKPESKRSKTATGPAAGLKCFSRRCRNRCIEPQMANPCRPVTGLQAGL